MNHITTPFSAKDWFEHGNQCQRTGDLPGALEAYRRSIKCHPRAAAPWIGLAQVLAANGQHEDAKQCLQHASQAEPRHLLARQQLAHAHKDLGELQAAQREYHAALELAPRSAATHFGLGQLYEDLGHPEQAAAAYRQALALEPSQRAPLANLLGLGRYVDISAELTQAQTILTQLQPRAQALVGYGLGKAYDQQQQYAKAFEAYAIANAARRTAFGPFQRHNFDTRIDSMISVFSERFFNLRQHWGDPS